jgi:hypothetical protein
MDSWLRLKIETTKKKEEKIGQLSPAFTLTKKKKKK